MSCIVMRSLDELDEEDDKGQAGVKREFISLEFKVENVDYYTIPHQQWDGFVGHGSHSSFTGTSPRTILKVKPFYYEDIPINQITFHGYSFIQAGDRIRAYIEKYEKSIDEELYLNLDDNPREEYKERKLGEKEEASLIEKLGSKKEVLATFVGVNVLE